MFYMENKNKLIDTMLKKSQDSFVLAIELFNKPTINLRVEGFCFFICNAWELMFKAYLLKNHKRIYYKDKKNTNRTISLTECVRSILTNDKDPVRINLEIIIGIRNTATHLIIPEYAYLMSSVFLACVKNYSLKMKSYFDIAVADNLSSGLLSLFIPDTINKGEILQKYGKNIATMYKSKETFLDSVFKDNSKDGIVSSNLALSMSISAVKSKDKADLKVYKSAKDDADAKIIIQPTDVNITHPLNRNKVIVMVNDELDQKGLKFNKISLISSDRFNSYTFNLFSNYYNIKQNQSYTYTHVIGKNKQYTYSLSLVQKIVNEIMENPNIFVSLKNKKS